MELTEASDSPALKVVLDDLATVRRAIEKGDRLMYAADNFSDRSTFAEAREALDRAEERQRRFLGLFEAVVPPVVASGNLGAEIVAHVDETLREEWEFPVVLDEEPEES